LVSNTAVAANPDVDYVAVRATVEKDGEKSSEVLVVAEPLLTAVAGEHEILKRFKGSELERVTYKRPFDYIEIPDSHFVVLATYVTTEDGSGLVHQAPAFGADDLQVCRSYGLPVVNPVAADGHFLADVPVVGGLFFKDADKPLVKELKANGVLYTSTHTHIAGVATLHLSITHNHPGISAQLLSRMRYYVRMRRPIGIQRQSRLVVMVIGSPTILTGRYRAIVTGAHRFQSGVARISMKFVSLH
jgi:hypothetical protein